MRKHNYVVGYEGERQCVYDDGYSYVNLLTLKQAQKLAKKIVTKYPDGKIDKSVVYKLVRVK